MIGLNSILLVFLIIGFNHFNNTNAIKCVSCSFAQNNCAQNPSGVKAHECLKDSKECFTALGTDGSIQRGCYYDNHIYCQGAYKCTRCSDDNCNNQIVPKHRILCYQCKGTKCLKPSNEYLLPCRIYNHDDECFTYSGINEFIRGCKSDYDYSYHCGSNEKNCPTCTASGCNQNEIKPLQCYYCSSSSDYCKQPENVEDLPKLQCEPDSDGNLCYTYVNKFNSMFRGCIRDKVHEENDEQGDYIEICKGDKCNNKRIEGINCPQCNTATDKECATKDYKAEWIKNVGCDELNSLCHLKCTNSDGYTFSGCGTPPVHSSNCTYCFEKCDQDNSQASTTTTTTTTEQTDILSCYQCRSDINENCEDVEDKIQSESCKNQGKDKRIGCYLENIDGLVKRGCQSDLTEKEFIKCKTNHYCKLCDTNDCNSEKSSATKSKISIMLSILLISYKMIFSD